MESRRYYSRLERLLDQVQHSHLPEADSEVIAELERKIETMMSEVVDYNSSMQDILASIALQIHSFSNDPHHGKMSWDTFPRIQPHSAMLLPSACALGAADPAEPMDRFVQVSRNLQNDTKMGYSNFKQASRSRTSSFAHGPRGERSLTEKLGSPQSMLGVAALGLALAFLSSSSPVPRSLLSRTWPYALQLAIAYFTYVRKKQDEMTDAQPRNNGVLYILFGLLQALTVIRDFRGHTPTSFLTGLLLGPVQPFISLMIRILTQVPSFLFQIVLLKGLTMVGKVSLFASAIIAIIAALGGLIVLAAEYV